MKHKTAELEGVDLDHLKGKLEGFVLVGYDTDGEEFARRSLKRAQDELALLANHSGVPEKD
jgi:hypothetical protein